MSVRLIAVVSILIAILVAATVVFWTNSKHSSSIRSKKETPLQPIRPIARVRAKPRPVIGVDSQHIIAGRSLRYDGKPVDAVHMVALSKNGDVLGTTYSDAQGDYKLRTATMPHRIVAKKSGLFFASGEQGKKAVPEARDLNFVALNKVRVLINVRPFDVPSVVKILDVTGSERASRVTDLEGNAIVELGEGIYIFSARSIDSTMMSKRIGESKLTARFGEQPDAQVVLIDRVQVTLTLKGTITQYNYSGADAYLLRIKKRKSIDESWSQIKSRVKSAKKATHSLTCDVGNWQFGVFLGQSLVGLSDVVRASSDHHSFNIAVNNQFLSEIARISVGRDLSTKKRHRFSCAYLADGKTKFLPVISDIHQGHASILAPEHDASARRALVYQSRKLVATFEIKSGNLNYDLPELGSIVTIMGLPGKGDRVRIYSILPEHFEIKLPNALRVGQSAKTVTNIASGKYRIEVESGQLKGQSRTLEVSKNKEVIIDFSNDK